MMPNGSPWPRISIVTPSYNQGQFIEETIRSVLLQGYPNLEYIVTDGGSTDGTVEIIKKYERWLGHWVSEPDRGQPEAINKGFARSRGEILAWINSDDTYGKGAVGLMSCCLVEHGADVVYGNVQIVNEKGDPIAEIRSVLFNRKAFIYGTVPIPAQSAVCWRRDIFFKVGRLNERLQFAMDCELLARFAYAEAKFVFLRACLGTYRCHKDSKTFGGRGGSAQESLTVDILSDIKKRRGYRLWRLLFRIRQAIVLIRQGDLDYVISRISSRFVKKATHILIVGYLLDSGSPHM